MKSIREIIEENKLYIFLRLTVSDFLYYHKVKPIEFKGFRLFCGEQGSGKTIAMTNFLNKMRRQYGNRINIITNYGYKYQDDKFNDWSDFLRIHKRPTIYAIDELQTYFFSRDYMKFPVGLINIITQTRKLVDHPVDKGIMIVGTSQVFSTVDKVIREQVNTVYDCKQFKFWKSQRLNLVLEYDAWDYNAKIRSTSIDNRAKIHKKSIKFVLQTNELREDYNSYTIISDIKKKYNNDGYSERIPNTDTVLFNQPEIKK